VNRQSFLEQLRLSELLSESQFAEVEARSGADAPLHEFITELVGQGWLTPFQVKRIFAGQGKGLVLGQYRILDELGRGGFGCVYKAMHGIMNRVVALKVIAPELVEESRARSWFRREVLAATHLYHPNIVMAYDANEVDDMLFLVMEYVEGLTLDQLVCKQGPLPIGLAYAMMHQVGRALQYAHEKDMVHRDIKPANLLIPNGTAVPAGPESASTPLVKVVDFGLARLHSKGSANTLHLHSEKGFVGTPAFISPEQARNIHEVDIRSDLYSLGCTFYYALSGKWPYRGQSPLEIVVQHLEKDAQPLTELRPEIPPGLASVIRRLMAKKPDQRFQTPADLIAELSFLCGVLPITAATPASSAEDLASSEESSLPRTCLVPSLPLSAFAPISVPSPLPLSPLAGRGVGVRGDDTVDKPNCQQGLPVAQAALATESDDQLSLAPRLQQQEATAEISIPYAIESDTRQHWNHWLAVIDALTEGRPPAVGELAYRTLHGQLTAAIRTGVKRGAPAAVWEGLDNLVAPWVTLNALSTTDRATLADLRRRCRAWGRELGLICQPESRLSWAAAIAIFLFAACIGTMLYAASRLDVSLPSLSAAGKFVGKNPVVVIPPALALGSFFLLPRLLRR
jgi:serine/threonine protein kinase